MTKCRPNCGACCDPVHLTAPKRRLLEIADQQPTPEAFRRWVNRLIPVGNAGDGVHYTFACPAFDRQTRSCLEYDRRPAICADFPWYWHGPAAPTEALERLGDSCSFIGDSLVHVAIGG